MSGHDRPIEVNLKPSAQVAPDSVESEPLWTASDVADYLRLKPETVRSMARRQEIPSVRIKRRWRFRRQDIEQWVEKKSATS